MGYGDMVWPAPYRIYLHSYCCAICIGIAITIAVGYSTSVPAYRIQIKLLDYTRDRRLLLFVQAIGQTISSCGLWITGYWMVFALVLPDRPPLEPLHPLSPGPPPHTDEAPVRARAPFFPCRHAGNVDKSTGDYSSSRAGSCSLGIDPCISVLSGA